MQRIVVLIPAYKEDHVILNTVREFLKVNYPKDLLEIIVIADSFKDKTLEILRNYPVIVHEVYFSERTKVKAIKSALGKIGCDKDIMVIIDADNIVEKDFLMSVSQIVSNGNKLIQGKRIIKNPGNDLAHLDDLSEQINNHINRKGVCNMGGSSSVAGSGFAVEYCLGKEIFFKLDSVGGFDKEFEILALKKGVKTKFVEDILIYDEKVETKGVFKNQRKRWVASQYAFLLKYFKYGIKALGKRDFASFNSSILRNIQFPRVLNLGIFSFLIVLTGIFKGGLSIPYLVWIIFYILFLLSILIAVPKRFYNFSTVLSFIRLPGIFFTMLAIMFKLKGANRVFLHTPHHSNLSKNDE
ncbi:MAG: glycosyltransferase [Cytophagales bacterium]|nr:glycosyltransferase [Cytophagales bacterium]